MLDDNLLRRYFPDLAERMPPQRATSLGSGVIVAREGYVLTNHHVIDGATRSSSCSRTAAASPRRCADPIPKPTLAVLKADAADLPAITLGISAACRSATSSSAIATRSASATR